MKKTKLLIISLTIVFLLIAISMVLCSRSFVNQVNNQTQENPTLINNYTFKQDSKKQLSNNMDKEGLVAKGNHIIVLREDLDFYVKHATTLGKKDKNIIIEEQLNYLIKKETLFYHAQKEGFVCSDNETKEYINNQIELVKKAQNYDDFLELIEGMDISEEEYWENQFVYTKKDLSISDYLNSKKLALSKENNLKFYPIDMVIDTSLSENNQSDYIKLEKIWTEYYADLVNRLIKSENVVLNIEEE